MIGDELADFTPVNQSGPDTSFATPDRRNGHWVLDFDAASAESADFEGVMPAHYNAGNVVVDIDFSATSATSGNVKWNVQVERLNTGGPDTDADDFASAQTATTACDGTSGKLARSSITLTQSQADSIAAGEAFRLRVTRDAADGADTMTGDAEIHRVRMREA